MTTTTLPAPVKQQSAGIPGRRAGRRPVWEEKPTAAGQAGKGLTLSVVLAVILVPVYCVVITSFSTQASINIAGGIVIWPHGLTLNAYRDMLTGGVVTRAVVIGLLVTVIGTAISMVVSVLCAYGLSRRRSFGHRTILMTLIVTMFFSGGLIPTFIVVADIFSGFNQYWALILPSAVSVFNILIIRGFYMNTANELIEAAKIDGASEWRILWSVVLPTSRAVNAVMALFYAVGYWNSWFNAYLYLQDSQKWPVQMVLYQYVSQGGTMPGVGTNMTGNAVSAEQAAPLSLQMAVVVITLIPVLIVYPFVQRHFTKGVLIGAIKG